MKAFADKYWKTILAFIGAVAVTAISAWSDHHISSAEGVQITTAFVSAVLVYIVPNVPQWPAVKTIVYALLAGLGLLASTIDNGSVGGSQIANAGALVIATIGVHLIDNHGDTLDQLTPAPTPGV